MELTHLQGRGVVWIQEDQVPVVRVRWVQSFQEVRVPKSTEKLLGSSPDISLGCHHCQLWRYSLHTCILVLA